MPEDGNDLDFNDINALDDGDYGNDDFSEEGQLPDGDGDEAGHGGSGGNDQDQAGYADDRLDASGQAPASREVGGKPSRAQARVESALREARESREQIAALQGRLDQLLSTQNRAGEEAREQERLAQMDPWERAEYRATRAEQGMANAVNQIRQEMAEANDKADFAARCARDPLVAKVRDQVEAQLSEARRNGVSVPRATLAAYIIGQQVMAKMETAKVRAGKKAAANVSRERARPTSGGSDATGGRVRDDRAARLERLTNASI